MMVSVTNADSGFANLQTWTDTNEDGVINAGEMKSLGEYLSPSPLPSPQGGEGVTAEDFNRMVMGNGVVQPTGGTTPPLPLEAATMPTMPTVKEPTMDYAYYRAMGATKVVHTDGNVYDTATNQPLISIDGEAIMGTDGNDVYSNPQYQLLTVRNCTPASSLPCRLDFIFDLEEVL